MADTSGFYKNENGMLLFAPNLVLNKNYQLVKEKKDEYKYPIDDWYWFDNEEEARLELSIEEKILDKEMSTDEAKKVINERIEEKIKEQEQDLEKIVIKELLDKNIIAKNKNELGEQIYVIKN